MARPSFLISLAVIALLRDTATVSGEVTLPDVFSNHMVLQRGVPLPVWGTASAGEHISITLGNETLRTIADQHGDWSVKFASREARNEPVTLTVEASNTLTVTDIVVGEVWLCSGQSNMHWPLKNGNNGTAEAESCNLPNLRLLNRSGNPYTNGRQFTDAELANCVPEKYLTGNWAVCSPATAAEFSAVAMSFGRELLDQLHVPIGLIHNGTGGTPTEAWISPQTLHADPEFASLFDNWSENELINSFCRNRAKTNLHLRINAPVLASSPLRHPYHPGFMYESGIAPLAPYAIRGVIWYQGESNVHNVDLHDRLFPALIADWRRVWGQGDFPFLYVQLPSLEGATKWPEFRESQRRALRIPNTGMAVTIDIGDPNDGHPRDKHDFGHRLAILARALVYGEAIEETGPTLQAVTAVGHTLRLSFTHTTGGLMTKDNQELIGFELAGKDGVFISAKATIEGNDLVVFSSDVAEPAAVRYGFAGNPRCNLRNGADLPASPFLTQVP